MPTLRCRYQQNLISQWIAKRWEFMTNGQTEKYVTTIIMVSLYYHLHRYKTVFTLLISHPIEL